MAAPEFVPVDFEDLPRTKVMLPAPKRFEKRPDSPYVSGRAGTIVARMAAVDLP